MRRQRKAQPESELDITSFMNLMIILVPVLLISMVFNQVTVLELNLPLDDEINKQDINPDDVSIEIIVRSTGFELGLGPLALKKIEKKAGAFDYETLSEALQSLKKQLKAKGDNRKDLVILSEPDIDYQVLIGVMDTARSYTAVVAASVVDAVLFPDVSLGDAPVVEALNLTEVTP